MTSFFSAKLLKILRRKKTIKYRILKHNKRKKEDSKMNVKHFVEDKVLVFEITEELDHHISEIIRRRIDYEIQRFMPKRVVFDFDSVTFMDSAGIGLIIGRYKFANMLGGKLEVANLTQSVRKIFEMSGILKLIPVTEL